jgi:hypothetical protein
MANQVRNIQYQNWGQWGQAHGLLRLNRLEEAHRALSNVAERLANQEDSGSQVVSFGLMAMVCMFLQHWDQMLDYARRLVSTDKRPTRFSIADFEGYASVGEVFLMLWQNNQAGQHREEIEISVEECKTAARRACKSMAGYARVYAIGQPRLHYLRGWLSALEGKRQQGLLLWNGGLEHARMLEMPYEEARLHDILSRHLPSQDPNAQLHREAARRLFEKLDAQLDLNQEGRR